MPAAELGRHAAIVGLSVAATHQSDDRRRYYLARRAECRYTPNDAPYGTPVRFSGRMLELDKRSGRAAVQAAAGGFPLASFEIDYTVLTDSAFERLFRIRGKSTPFAPSPYGSLLSTAWHGTTDCAEQVVEAVQVNACEGHFEGFPALPVAVLMGQLSYLAGRVHGGSFRVVRGEVEASDLVWAGERALFRAARVGQGDGQGVGQGVGQGDGQGDGLVDGPDTLGAQRYRCEAWAGERPVAAMTLWLRSVDEGVAHETLLDRG